VSPDGVTPAERPIARSAAFFFRRGYSGSNPASRRPSPDWPPRAGAARRTSWLTRRDVLLAGMRRFTSWTEAPRETHPRSTAPHFSSERVIGDEATPRARVRRPEGDEPSRLHAHVPKGGRSCVRSGSEIAERLPARPRRREFLDPSMEPSGFTCGAPRCRRMLRRRPPFARRIHRAGGSKLRQGCAS